VVTRTIHVDKVELIEAYGRFAIGLHRHGVGSLAVALDPEARYVVSTDGGDYEQTDSVERYLAAFLSDEIRQFLPDEKGG
jgi:hypothetical protein